jgi:hypothetical protein
VGEEAQKHEPIGVKIALIGFVVTLVALAVAAATALLVFGAYGCGKLFGRWLSFSPFEATVISLLALMFSLVIVAKAVSRIFSSVAVSHGDWEEKEPAFADEEDSSEGVNEGLRLALYASGAVKPNAPCPCGSGRRYNRCCGEDRLFRSQRRSGHEEQ